MKQVLFSFLLVLLSLSGIAQQKKVRVLGYEKNLDAPIPGVTSKKGELYYDSRVIGYPRFFSGSIITTTGDELKGQLAFFNNTADWTFLKRAILFIPEGTEVAQYITSESIVEAIQEQKKASVSYDNYGGLLLQRLVSGPLQLSYNPAANSSRALSSFVSREFMDSVRKNILQNSIKKDLEQGKTVRQSLEKAKLKAEIMDVASSIEIVDKEYLLYNRETGKTDALTRTNYRTILQPYFEACSAMDSKATKKALASYKKIEEAIADLNKNCL